MNTIHFHAAPLSAENVDTVNGVIRNVSIITAGIVARGHDLTVDATTIREMKACALAKGQIPCRLDHKAGAASVIGYLTNFRESGQKLIGDLFLLAMHPQTAQILETAQRMPQGMGLSASFVTPDNAERGKARCQEIISVDIVPLPAANPDGFFSARTESERPLTGVEKVRRVISASGRGAEVGAVGGLAARALLRRRGITRVTGDGAATTGAAVGALTAGALQWRRDSRPRDFAAHVTTILFENRATISRLIDATRRNVSVPVPGVDEAATVVRVAKKPLVRRIGTRLLKVGAGAGLGYAVGRKVGARAGAVTGAVAGLLFSSPEARATVRLAHVYAKTVTNL